ncbi:heme-containing dehydratase-domain containing protein [Aspergillus crustosus]
MAYEAKLPPTTPITVSVFGIQHHTPTQDPSSLITTLRSLLADAPPPVHTETLTQDTPVRTTILLTHWPSHTSFNTWFTSQPVSSFWSSLSEKDAGVYREIITVPPSLTQHATSNPTRPCGLARLGTLEPLQGKSGYWGCYYDRMGEGTGSREMNTETVFQKAEEAADLKAGAGVGVAAGGKCPFQDKDTEGPPSLSPPSLHSTISSPDGTGPATAPESAISSTPSNITIHPGRLTPPPLPNNICFVIEGQDHALLHPLEKAHWHKDLDGSVSSWIEDLVTASKTPSDTGVLEARICYDGDSGLYHPDEKEIQTPAALDYNRKVQLFYFSDMHAMEKIGRENQGHVRLRRRFLQDYGPGGVMAQIQENAMNHGGPGLGLLLWVECSILQGRDIECEYVGCVEGTGLMGVKWA